MATLWRKTMYHLGLAPEDEYDDYEDDLPAVEPPRRSTLPTRPAPRQAPPEVAYEDEPPPTSAIGAVRPIRSAEPGEPERRAEPVRHTQTVRPMPVAANAKPHAVSPVSFNDAQELADKFKGNQPVIMNLQNADRDLARRLIDFASGLCYGVGGQMEKVANSVYLLTPSNVEVSAEERRRMQERDYSDQ